MLIKYQMQAAIRSRYSKRDAVFRCRRDTQREGLDRLTRRGRRLQPVRSRPEPISQTLLPQPFLQQLRA